MSGSSSPEGLKMSRSGTFDLVKAVFNDGRGDVILTVILPRCFVDEETETEFEGREREASVLLQIVNEGHSYYLSR